MFIYDTMSQGLELLARRELQDAENLFLNVINDPYSQPQEIKQAKQYLNEGPLWGSWNNAARAIQLPLPPLPRAN